ncbi:hypothetical protein [Candidatus Nitrosocosmicus oleophilus]|uniref:hypothetical protein n=1 Tax=Candidatus Nitrosocosmicus oleophilus TaxID=1353260 RepID=UPI0018CB55A0|nr:hypothetical protein [Candidatus Nitrosocosmicus oleophilus]
MITETSQSDVTLSFETPLITSELFEFNGTRSPLSGEIIFTPPVSFVIFDTVSEAMGTEVIGTDVFVVLAVVFCCANTWMFAL